MKHFGVGRPMESSNKATLLPWRASVIAHVRQQMERGGEWPVDGPVRVAVTFHLQRPVSAPKWRLWPDRKPDLDKLVRAALDAVTQAGALADDARVVHIDARKDYGNPGMTLHLCPLAQPARRTA